jgi:SAM-dependent methyltransferase
LRPVHWVRVAVVSGPHEEARMNDQHARLCSSPEWADYIATDVLPSAVGTLSLGDEVLEIGPGYGASTRVLVEVVPRLSAVEVDAGLAADLAAGYPAVDVVHGSGDALPFDDGRFTAVVCFTMLHHVDSPDRQDRLFAEARRVLAAGGVFAGSDSTGTDARRGFHAGDTYVPVEPGALPDRLRAAGFGEVTVEVPDPEFFTFVARR